jgi:two-component system, cell cycle sensor histidine kinase and response regulator CckA
LENIKRILFMDDNEDLIKTVKHIFKNINLEAEFARNGNEMIDLYTDAMHENNTFDIVILDLTISGGMGGREAMRKLLEINKNVIAIVTSGYSDDAILSDYKNYGFSAVLRKPFDLDMLVNVINESLNFAERRQTVSR